MGAVSVGVFGGAFDPPHVGHVELARAADRALRPRPAARPRRRGSRGHKDVGRRPTSGSSSPSSRSGRSRAAEVALDPFARTVDSLVALGLDDPVFLVGADEFASFLDLEGARARPRARAARRGDAPGGRPRGRLDAVLARLERPERVSFFEIEPLPVSSSDIRARSAGGADRRPRPAGGRSRDRPRWGSTALVDPARRRGYASGKGSRRSRERRPNGRPT